MKVRVRRLNESLLCHIWGHTSMLDGIGYVIHIDLLPVLVQAGRGQHCLARARVCNVCN